MELTEILTKRTGTGQDQITYIDLDLLDPDERNFYSLDGLNELAGNIELLGLQQPLRVRPGEGGRYTIVSGHRRRAACMLIRGGGSDMFAGGVPCIVEYGEASEAMQELRLIYANAATRVMGPAEISRQAERVEALLYELKEKEGIEFPGRMRDHVAQACQVSKSKIARLHAIRNNLTPEMLEKFDAGDLNESVAYRISQEETDVQDALAEKTGGSLREYDIHETEAAISQIKAPRMEPQKHTPAPGESSFDVDAYLDNRRREDDEYADMLSHFRETFFRELGWMNSRQEGIETLKNKFGKFYMGHGEPTRGAPSYQSDPNGLVMHRAGENAQIRRTWTEVYDLLCTFALTEAFQRQAEAAQKKTAGKRTETNFVTPGKWSTGAPPKPGEYLAVLGVGQEETPQASFYRVIQWTKSEGWCQCKSHAPIKETIFRWLQLPEV